MLTRLIAVYSILLAAALPDHTPGENGQGPSVSGANLATIVIKERFSSRGLIAVVRRTRGSGGATMIAMKRSAATPQLLATTLATLAELRERDGEAPSQTMTVYISGTLPNRPFSQNEIQKATSTLSLLLATPARPVPSVGNVPAITIRFPL